MFITDKFDWILARACDQPTTIYSDGPYTGTMCDFMGCIGHQPLKRVSEHHSIHHRHGLLPVSIILDGGAIWSKDEVFRVVQGILGPLAPRFSVRVKMVDEIDEGRQQRTPTVNVVQ